MTLPPASTDGLPEPDFDALLEAARGHFDRSVDGTLGVEEEFAICEPGSLDLVPRYDELREVALEAGLGGAVAGELLASEIEFRTGRCESWTQAAEELLDIRRRVSMAASDCDAVLGASATHPWAD